MENTMKVFLDEEKNVEAIVSGQSIIRINFNNPVKHLAIPSECGGLTIQGIGNGINSVFGLDLFQKMEFESIAIDDKVNKINPLAFRNISAQDFFWPSGCDTVPTDCFYSSSIVNFHGSENIKEVKERSFCAVRVSSLYLKNLEVIGEMAFSGSVIKSLNFGTNIKSVEERAFQGLRGITEFKWFENLNSIPGECFKFSSIKKVTGMDHVTSIEPSAFANTVIEEIEWPKNCTEIPARCFMASKNLKKVTGIENVTSIASKAFSYCKALSEFNFPEGLEKIESYAFSNTNLSKIDLEKTCVECVDEYIFSYIDSLCTFLPPHAAIVYGEAFYATNVLNLPHELRRSHNG